jgi:hypothetical protein
MAINASLLLSEPSHPELHGKMVPRCVYFIHGFLVGQIDDFVDCFLDPLLVVDGPMKLPRQAFRHVP